MSGQFSAIKGDSGEITAAAGAQVAHIGRWRMEPSGHKPDGSTRLRFKAQFSWKQDGLFAMCLRGALKPRVRVHMTTKFGQEDVDILDWQEMRWDGAILTIEDPVTFIGTKVSKMKTR